MFVTSAYAEEATTAGTAVPVEGGHGGNTFPPFDPTTFSSQLVWLAITFGLFYL
ncbi:ATP F0F1 synthase subunit B, partial [Streptococcus pyogenes]